MESGQLLYYTLWGEAGYGTPFEIKGIARLKIDEKGNKQLVGSQLNHLSC